MGDKSNIEWTDATWNPVTGCTKVSPGCDHCYAETITERFHGKGSFAKIELHPDRLDLPLRWKKPRMVFVNSMSDLFHAEIPRDMTAKIFAIMAVTPKHTYQILTKRPGVMRSLLNDPDFLTEVDEEVTELMGRGVKTDDSIIFKRRVPEGNLWGPAIWPLPNVWLGVSAEDQKWADVRIPLLLQTPAAVRFVSAEPLLGPVDLLQSTNLTPGINYEGLDWVIVGGESGPKARPMHPDWVRRIRNTCNDVGIAFFFKQWGEYVPCPLYDAPNMVTGRAFHHPKGGQVAPMIRDGRVRRKMQLGDVTVGYAMIDSDLVHVKVGKKLAGRELDGMTWDEFPLPGQSLDKIGVPD